ncbi:MAG: hypothetical protein AB7N76_02940 [Planctomycetota bacterium]
MKQRTLTLTLCLLVAGCGGSSGPRGAASSAAPATSATATGTTSATAAAPPSTAPVPSAAPALPANFQPVTFQTLEQGDGSLRGSLGAHEVQVGTDAEWAAFWPTHSQGRQPSVDFSREAVVGTFMGQLGGQSHFTRILGVERDANGDDLRVLVREFRLAPWKPNTRILTAPFQLVRCDTRVSGTGALGVRRQALLDFEPLLAGPDAALGANDPTYKGGLRVARDAAELSALYAQIVPNVRPPGVDFSNSMVVAILGPYVPSFGNSVEALRIVADPAQNELRVLSRVNPYRGGAAPPPATETPYLFLRVARAGGTIRAERSASATLTPRSAGVTTLYTGPGEDLLVRDAASFQALWAAQIGGAAPRVDFSQDQVLVALRPANTGITTLEVERAALLEDDELSVVVATQSFGRPAPGGRYAVATTLRTHGAARWETVDRTPPP